MLFRSHEVVAWFLIISNGVAGCWALGAHRVQRLRVSGLWALVIAAQLSTFASGVTGVLLVNLEQRPLGDFHALYGFSTIITVAILYSYRRSSFLGDRRYLLYGFGSLFLMGLGIRNLVL